MSLHVPPRAARMAVQAMAFAVWCLAIPLAKAQHVSVRSFGEAEGLNEEAVWHLAQEPEGFLVVGTESGLFVFDGRIFFRLGTEQGLPLHIGVRALITTPDGRIAMADDHRVLLSRTAADAVHPIPTLQFDDVTPAGRSRDQTFHGLLWWHGSLLAQLGGRIVPVRSARMSPLPDVLRSIGNVSGMAARDDTLWIGTTDGRLCRMTSTTADCRQTADPVSHGPPDDWAAVAIGKDGTVYARSAHHFASRPAGATTFRIESITDDRVGDGFQNHVRLTIMPDGTVVTEALGRLLVRNGSSWRILNLPPECAGGVASALLGGRDGELWVSLPGNGLAEVANFGGIENFAAADGLDVGEIWQIVRQDHGLLLIGSSRGVVRMGVTGDPLFRLAPDPASYMVQSSIDGQIWASHGINQVVNLSPSGQIQHSFQVSGLHQLLLDRDKVLWLLTAHGLDHIDTAASEPRTVQPDPHLRTPLLAGLRDSSGRLWLAGPDRLLLRWPDGRVETLLDHWPSADFLPATLVEIGSDHVWIAGSGGLMSIVRTAPNHASASPVAGPRILGRTFYSLVRDNAGRIWAGTDHGVAAFDGQRWINVSMNEGLVWNETNEFAIFIDTDETVWVGTSRGLSHFTRPELLFRHRDLQAVVSSIQIGAHAFRGRAVPFSYDPVMIRFTVLDLPRAHNLHFRYRLAGVDQDWIETSSNFARYPSLPPGHHDFSVVAFDPMTGDQSAPAHILLRMRMPWWRWWPVEALYGLLTGLALLTVLHLRGRMLKRQRRILQQTVEQRTLELEAARAALEHEARTDSVTGLLNRRAIQQHLSEHLSGVNFASGRGHHRVANNEPSLPCAVALLDIDHFKRINDVHGHLVGDQILREMGERLGAFLAPEEFCGRYGGEEFLFISGLAGQPGMQRLIALIQSLTQVPFGHGGAPIHITLSVGMATVQPSDNWETVISRADKALYDAKAAGRDRIVEAA
jgi:diguanylate cyclase (GGDEF)-like protein